MTVPQKHPADDLAAALARINGMLTMLSGVYDPNNGTFVTGIPFVHESIQAMEVLIARATEALTVVYQTCDLAVVREIPPKRVAVKEEAKAPEPSKLAQAALAFDDATKLAATARALVDVAELVPPVVGFTPTLHEAEVMRAKPAHVQPAPKPESYMHTFGPDTLPSRLTERVEKTLGATVAAPAPKPVVAQPLAHTEKRAESYEDLLRKITTVSSQAASDGNGTTMDRALLPIVEGIRADLAKMRSVA